MAFSAVNRRHFWSDLDYVATKIGSNDFCDWVFWNFFGKKFFTLFKKLQVRATVNPVANSYSIAPETLFHR